MVAIAVDRYVCICHPLRHLTVATACRARAVVIILALIAVVLGLLGAALFSVYHIFPISGNLSDVTVAMTPASVANDAHTEGWQLYDITNTLSIISDSEREDVASSACARGSNQTECSTSYTLMNTGYCGQSHLILSETFLDCYHVIHLLIYPFCLITVLVLYSLIYRTVLVQRARRLKMRSSATTQARPPTSPPPLANSAAGILLLLLILYTV